MASAGETADVRENVRESGGRTSPLARVGRVWAFRELLVTLVRRELKVRYKGSILGFFWTLVNPLMYLVVYSIVFSTIMDVNVPDYGIFFLSGLLAWNLLAGGVAAATSSIVDNAPLVTKVWFPRELLPLAAIGSNVVNFFFQSLVLLGAMVVLGHAPAWSYLPELAVALVVLLVLVTAVGLATSVVFVHLRDMRYLVELGLLVWFWLSAVVYPYGLVVDRLGDRADLLLLNPMIPVITTFQRAIYDPPVGSGILTEGRTPLDHLTDLGIVGAGALVLLLGSLLLFGRLEDDLAESI